MEFETVENLIQISIQMSETYSTEQEFETLALNGNQHVDRLTAIIQNQTHTVQIMMKIVIIVFKLRELQFRNFFFEDAVTEFQSNRIDGTAMEAKILIIQDIFRTADSLLEESDLQIHDLFDELTSNLILQRTRFEQLHHRYLNIMLSETKVPDTRLRL
tara:strand:- start:6240 stop:6716 length:477 start_codon:yes stop_codon:yes gene_type:complete